MKKPSLPLNKEKIENFCRKNHIVYLALFGSVLTSQFTEKSDLDVLVKFEEKHIPHLFGFIDLESELSDLVEWHVDLKTPDDLSPYFRDEVLAEAKVIYGK